MLTWTHRLQIAIDEALEPLNGPKPTIHIVEIDMTSFQSIRRGAAEINAQQEPIDVSISNQCDFSPLCGLISRSMLSPT